MAVYYNCDITYNAADCIPANNSYLMHTSYSMVESRGKEGLTWQYLAVRLDPASYLDDLKAKVLPHTHPGWEPGLLEASPMELGTTNSVILLKHRAERAILRVNGRGSEKLVNREREVEVMVALGQAGLCSPVFCQLENGLLYGYAPGRPLTLEDVRQEGLMRKIAVSLARLHMVKLPPPSGGAELLLWDKYDCWLEGLPMELDTDPEFSSRIGTLQNLKTESQWLKQQTAELGSPIVFCHSDLNKPNVIYNEATTTVTLVDFEYAGPNYLAFDLANWLCETEIELEHYPSDSYCRWWLEMYLKEAAKLEGASNMTGASRKTGRQAEMEEKPDVAEEDLKEKCVSQEEPSWSEVDSRELDSLQHEVSLFSLASHLLWCVWALHQAVHSSLDFDFMNYAALRHSLFVRYRAQFCETQLP